MKVTFLSGWCAIGLALATSYAASPDERLAPATALPPSSRLLTVSTAPANNTDDPRLEPRLEPTIFVARLIVQLPTNLNQAPEAINGVAMTALSLAGLAADPDLLQEAWVSFDAPHQQWKALWPKPPMFHYGMVLLPALVKKLNAGQSFDFQSQGQTASLTKDDKGQLMVKRGSSTAPLTASDLRDLLRAKINAEGMTLFLDKSGNLILEASGARAMALGGVNSKTAKQP